MSFEKWLEAKGFGGVTLTDAQRASLMAAWTAETNPPPPVPPPTTIPTPADRTRAQIEAARQREKEAEEISGMIEAALGARRITADQAEHIQLKAAAETWTKKDVELEILRAERPQPGLAMPRRKEETDDVIEAAVCLAGGLENIEKHFHEQVLEAAHKTFRNGLHLSDVLMVYAQRGGYRGTSIKSSIKDALQAAFAGPDIRGAGSWGPSTGGGLSGVLSNVANKFMRAGFEAIDDTWRRISAIRTVTDFKQISSYSLTGDMTYKKVAPGGEITHGKLGAETYTNQAETYGRMIGIDRRDIINDDLGALTGVSRRLGRGGGLKINNIFWTIFLNNSSFFTAGRNNVSTGAGSALGTAGLDAANVKFLAQTDPDGEPAGFMPKILLAPSALWGTGAALMQSTGLNQTPASNAAAPNQNIWANRFQLESSPYMSNSTYTGNSATAWYLLADPADAAVIEVAFLNGNQIPTVETADADFSMLGIALRGYHDFGVALQEYRAGVRSAGS